MLLLLTLLAQSPCDSLEPYRCMELHPSDRAPEARGFVRLVDVPSPFGVAVTADGRPEVRLVIALRGLPDTTLVAWVATPTLSQIEPLGLVTNGVTDLGIIAYNKFLILVSIEGAPGATERRGPLVLRGRSPSMLMQGHDMLAEAPAAVARPPDAPHAHGGRPPMYPGLAMFPGLMGLTPDVAPLSLPSPEGLPEAVPGQVVDLPDGGTLDLAAGFVRRTIGGRAVTMLAFNGQHPGPLIRVRQGTTIFVNFVNDTPFPTAVHWHGVRLNNRFDGVPHVTQAPVEPGGRFQYRVHFRDAGIYWYHPHHREDVQQELGLYGNLLVDATEDHLGPVNREQALMLDDILIGEDGIAPLGSEAATFAMMGRFGNVFLVNGEPEWTMTVDRGAVVRFSLTNAANTRVFNVSFMGPDSAPLAMKLVASDVSRFERETWVDHVTLGPAERYVVEVRFPDAGAWALVNRVQAVDHMRGRHFPEATTLGTVSVGAEAVELDLAESFGHLTAHEDISREISALRPHFDRPADHELTLTMEPVDLPDVLHQIMQFERLYFSPIEWSGTMPDMNWVVTGNRVRWILRDEQGRENEDIRWRHRVGDVVRITVINDADAFHAMQHPLHIHGQRFLVLSRDDVPRDNLVWKDTVLLPTGTTTELLLEISNPGRWMVHCHIAEHLEAGMRFVMDVDP